MMRLVTLLLTILLCFQSCKRPEKREPNVLNVGLRSEVPTFDPANAYDVVSANILYQSMETLYEYHYLKRPYTIKPLLADGMPIIKDDGKTYIVKIKKGIFFHPHKSFGGKKRELKAMDFITQIKRLSYAPTRSKGSWIFSGILKGFSEFRKKAGKDFEKFKSTPINGLRALDDYTLEFKLERAYPQMPYILAMSFTSPTPLELVEELNNDLSNVLIGTGPFILTKANKKSSLEMVANPEYRDEKYPTEGDRIANALGLLKDSGKKLPFLKKINFMVIKEAQTRWLNFRKKKIDILVIPKDNYASAINSAGGLSKELEDEGIKLFMSPTLTYWWISFNMKDPVLGKNKALRKAIAHAIDTEKYIRIFTNNIGLKANSIYPPGIPGYDPAAELPYKYDLKKARRLLSEAGFPGGKGLPEFTFDLRSTNTVSRQHGEFIKSELEKIGVKIKVSLNTFPAFLEKSKKGKLQFWGDGWAMDYPDAENSLLLLTKHSFPPGPNSSWFTHPEVEKRYARLKVLQNNEEKFKLMKEIEAIVHEENPWIMQYFAREYILYHSPLQNYRPSGIINGSYKYLKILP